MSARLLRAIVDRISGERDADEVPELTALLRVLAAAGQIEPDDAVADIEQRLPEAICDTTEARSLRSTVSETARLASTVRDRLPHDTWRAINRVEEQFIPAGRQDVLPLDEVLELLDQLIIDGMVRGPAWRFLDVGRRIERAQLTCYLLLGILPGRNLPPASVLDAVLDVMDLQMTCRARYLAALRTAPVLDLLVADETNPRSLIAQMRQLSQHIDRLPVGKQRVGLSDEEKTISTTLHQVQVVDINELVENVVAGKPAPLSEFLNRQKQII